MSAISEHVRPLSPVADEPLAEVPLSRQGRPKNARYVVLRVSGDGNTAEILTVEPIAATSRKEAVKAATQGLPADERSGEFVIVLETAWTTLRRKFERKTIEEDSFE